MRVILARSSLQRTCLLLENALLFHTSEFAVSLDKISDTSLPPLRDMTCFNAFILTEQIRYHGQIWSILKRKTPFSVGWADCFVFFSRTINHAFFQRSVLLQPIYNSLESFVPNIFISCKFNARFS
eukprot:TRINITY_DN1012_c0_g1_i4.p1 TRINITY_DN1012_c0_g1~~TRINITY_DN1012_c0_g1_i4.p1  ORF type:complete len:126 (-),score=15.12 TRINITY_DN1012_c0_g1_i4:685-1062(-)